MAEFRRALQVVAGNEGGFVNDSRDPGGMTNYGVTAGTLGRMQAQGLVPELAGKTVRDLTPEDAALVFERGYWNMVKGYRVPSQSIATELLDTAVNASPRKAVRFLQEALNTLGNYTLVEDGVMGDQTLGVLTNYLLRRRMNEMILHKALNGLQFGYYWGLARKREQLQVFIEGWINLRITFGGK